MKLTIYEVESKLTNDKDGKVEIDCKGKGTVNDPVILNSSSELPKWFRIINSQLHLRIDNCYNHRISLIFCQNVTIRNCSLEALYLDNCSGNFIERCHKIEHLDMYMSNKNLINRSSITKLKMVHSNNNTIQDCTITEIRYKNNKENEFNNNIIPIKEQLIITKKPLHVSRNLKIILYVFMVITSYIVIFSFMFTFPSFFFLGIVLLIIATFSSCLMPIIVIKSNKEGGEEHFL